ncbi:MULTISPECIES: TonB-dependent receptor [unclassified Cellulophaga]|uniref:TonB-dependent receptor n=1 Tax=unclassified Cellulophaga TaxID=2634405 RepID=UPI0026E1F6B1|nr:MULTISPECIES: TonB-dependent receptor [unclassified Cellulophaga]MDO6490030.1 TonB-dependent receptor [Cellulophaga sp. 2_MG-2023]MDO6494776.1 TonB-dependent receptor [Cellulophaga sp. 3_MG-2023]
MKNYLSRKLLGLIFLVSPLFAMAQGEISGTVTDQNNELLPGVNIVIKGTTNGTTTDFDGNYSITAESFPATLIFSSIGFNTKEMVVNAAGKVNMTLQEGLALDEVVLTGNRSKPRTILDSPVPIDNIGVAELTSSGKPTVDRMLTFKVPSFNAQTQAISDATAHYDPADLRGLGPSRTLVLVNGKRKNQSAQVYLNRTPGKGEVGVDLKSIPTAAIERVEVLRDGASAQYGSDAIAGVINMVLKKNAKYTTVSARTGITSEGDGFNFAADMNTAFNFGDGGFINLTLGYYNQQLTNRAGSPGIADLPNDARPNEIQWATENPELGMKVGQPDLEKGDLFINLGHPLGENAELYSFHGYSTRKGRSFAYYRAPYWRRDVADSEFLTRSEDFVGYQPSFEAEIDDHINALGVKFDITDTFNADASVTYGSNSVDYTVNNSLNRDYLADKGTSPRSFSPGGYTLSNVVMNLDFANVFSEQLSSSFGIEYKKEYYEAREGNPLSYYKGGSDSFAGIKPDEAGKWNRDNLAFYAGLDYDITEDLLLGLAGRYEDFSDFGDNFSWKVFGRYKIGDKGAIRGSYSTGFRAPTLHQRYLTNSQYIIADGSPEPVLQGTLANDNQAVKDLGVPSLFAETSRNISAGFTYKINPKFSASIDFYQIYVDDRVLFSSQQGYKQDAGDVDTDNDGDVEGDELLQDVNPVEQILIDNNVVALQYFINAGDTKTTGVDFVLNYRGINMGEGKLNVSLAANVNETTIDAIETPQVLADNGYNIFTREEKGLIINSRPKSKFILGIDYDTDKFNIGLNNTLFGKVTVTAPETGGIDQELSSMLVTDLNLSYKVTDKLSFTGTINNMFDVYPDKTLATTNTAEAGGRFQYSSEVQQGGQFGANFSLGMNYRF